MRSFFYLSISSTVRELETVDVGYKWKFIFLIKSLVSHKDVAGFYMYLPKIYLFIQDVYVMERLEKCLKNKEIMYQYIYVSIVNIKNLSIKMLIVGDILLDFVVICI